MQLAPLASELAHSSASRNEVGLVPPNVTPVIVSGEVPVFFNVTACAALVVPTAVDANVSDAGVIVTVGFAMPVPVRVADWGEPVAVSVTVTFAVRVPRAAGLKTTATGQLAPAASVVPQVVRS